jgi:hypothetical protein
MVETNKGLIAYCGLYCGDCFGYKGTIADLARDLRKELRQVRFDRTARGLSKYFKQFENYDQCYELLGLFVKFRCKRTCHNGGGPPFCKIRTCCVKKGLYGCWECSEFETCKKLKFLVGVHGEGHVRNLRILKKKGVKAFLKGKKYWFA